MRAKAPTRSCALALLAAVTAVAAPAGAGASRPSLAQRVERYLQPFLEVGHLSGTLLIARGEEVEYERSFGFADREHRVPNRPRTRFCVGSINKPMTIVILGRLLELGRLELDDKLTRFLPDFPRGDEITVGDLLRHSAGIPHRVTGPLDETRPQTPASMVELAARRELVFEPGEQSVYSSAGFSVLARVLELAAGMPYAELLAEHVLEPAGMTDTADPGSRELLEDRASSYYFDSDGLVNAPPADVSYLVGAGSVYSTPRDLFAMQRALLAGRLGQRAREALVRENGDVRWNGSALGFRAFADYEAASDVTVVLASNLTSGAVDRIREAVPRIAAGEEVPTPAPIGATAAVVDPELFRKYEGAYELRPGRNLVLRVLDGRVMMEEWLLIPSSERTLFSPQDYAEIEVVLDDDGEVTRLDWTTGGQTYPLPRVDSAGAVGADPRAAVIDAFIAPFADLAMFDGTVLVDVGGETVYRKSFGFAHYELGVRHDDDTKFRIASVSKTLTDAAFAVLVQRGDLTLETPLADYLPAFPSARKITIGQLLDHTSGIAHTNDLPWGDGATSLALDEVVRRLAALPLDFEPGARRSYSNGGYAVAARVLELAAGSSYADVMRRLVFEPLGMGDSGHIADARRPIANMATGYEPGPRPGERRHARFYAAETLPGGGSLYATAGDLARFARAVFREGFLEPSLVRSVLGADDGPFISQGRSPGFVAKLYYDPVRDVVVVSLANSYAVPADWAATLADLATGAARAAPWPPIRRAEGPVAPTDRRLGRYRSSRGDGELSVEGNAHGEMVLRDGAGAAVTALVPLADGAFLLPSYYQRCEQEATSRAVTCRMLSGNPGYTSEWTPIGPATEAPDEVTEYRGGRLFNGREFEAASLCVSGGQIVTCAESADRVVSLEGGFVVPPLADAHTHHFDGPFTLAWHRAAYLQAGVFYAMTLTAPSRSVAEIRDRLSGPKNVDVATALGGVTGPDSHPAEIYEALALGIRGYEEQVARAEEIRASRRSADDAYFLVETAADVEAKWPLILGNAPDLVKVFLRESERYDEGYGKWGPGGGIDPKLLPLIRRLSREAGLRLAVASSNLGDFRAAVAAGADLVTHLPCYQDSMSDPESPYYDVDTAEECLLSAADAEAAAAAGMGSVLIVSQWALARPEVYVDWERRNVAALEAAGAPLAVGSNAYGATVIDGLIAGVEKGWFEPARLLRLATSETARMIFPDREVGCLEPGCEASFLVLEGDPLEDFKRLRTIRLRVKDGEPLTPEEIEGG